MYESMYEYYLKNSSPNDKMDKHTANDAVCLSLSICLKRIKLRLKNHTIAN